MALRLLGLFLLGVASAVENSRGTPPASPEEEAGLPEAWEEDEACEGQEGERCALSLRQLRGLARKQEAVQAEQPHQEEAQRARETAGAGGEGPHDYVLGVPLFLHKDEATYAEADDLHAGVAPQAVNGQPTVRALRWIVNLASKKGNLGAGRDEQHSAAPFFFVSGSREDLERELAARSDEVHFVEQDAVLRMVPELDVGEGEEDLDVLKARPQVAGALEGEDQIEEEPPASWGLDRIDAKEGLDHWYEYAGYGGKGTHVYMLDTGIRWTHVDFGGRALPTIQVDGDGLQVCNKTNMSCAMDALGHGSHTAGTVAGHRYGVAKAATLHACKILDDSGSGLISWMVEGLDWVVNNHEKPALISASLGGHYDSPSLTRAVDGAVDRGITVVVAAGNENDDACKYMPARVPSAITVGAIAVGDSRAPYSNYGSCLDIFAPGSDILSTDVETDFTSRRMSGTSMACPHVAGAAALLLAQDPTRSPAEIRRLLMTEASLEKVMDVAGSPNRLLYTEPPKPHVVEHDSKPHFEVYEGPCEVDKSGCIASPGFPASGYGESERCSILVAGDVGHVHVEAFDTERSFDSLQVNFERYSGSMTRGNAGLLECVKPVGAIIWSSDRTDERSGWKVCPESKPPADAPRGFYVACGRCTADAEGCVASPNYPGNYSSHGSCRIDVVGDVEAIEVEAFDTEAGYDKLYVDGQNYSGTEGPSGVKPTSQLVWTSDAEGQTRGWKLCPTASG